MPSARRKPAERFAEKISVDEKTGCWNWTASKDNDGYGWFKVEPYKTGKAHRLSYAMFKGDPTGWSVLHKCHNRACVNPNHLYLGTHKDNMRDLRESGRRKRKCKK